MTNKKRAIIHFTVGFAAAFIASGIFILLIVSGANMGDITNVWDFSALAFGSSLIFFGLVYGVLTASLSQGSKPIRMIVPWALTTFVMSVLITFIAAGIYGSDIDFTLLAVQNNMAVKIILFIIIVIASWVMITISQIYNTKFLLISTAKGRADEWEISEFLNMLISRTDIKHEERYSILYSKNTRLLLKFIPEEEIERRINLSGATINKDVNDLKLNIKNDEKGAIVFLSNKLPVVDGHDDQILIIKNEDLFKEFKKLNKPKGNINEKS